jgi:hypothetical protein
MIDIKRNVGAGSSKPQNFRLFFKRRDSPTKPPKPPHMDFNLDSFNNDSFFSYHQHNHSETNFPSVGKLHGPGDKSVVRSIEIK